MKRFLALILILAAHAQAYELSDWRMPATITFHADSELRDATIRGLKKWNKVLNNHFTLVESDNAPVLTVQCISPLLWGNFALAGTWHGLTFVAYPQMPGFNLDTIILHEMGHALGLNHSADLKAIMYPIVYPGELPVLSRDDKQGIRKAYPKHPRIL